MEHFYFLILTLTLELFITYTYTYLYIHNIYTTYTHNHHNMYSPFLFFLFFMRPFSHIIQNQQQPCFHSPTFIHMLKHPNHNSVENMDIFDRFEKYSIEKNPFLQRAYLNLIIKQINNQSNISTNEIHQIL